MKPRLNPLPLTDEDYEIVVGLMAWWHKRYRRSGLPVFEAYQADDRRDAEVMYRLGMIRHRFYAAAVMLLGRDKPTAPGILSAACRHERDPGRAFEMDYRP